jgi:hypothetical protein
MILPFARLAMRIFPSSMSFLKFQSRHSLAHDIAQRNAGHELAQLVEDG